MVRIYELLVYVRLKKNVFLKNMAEEMSIAINHLLKYDDELSAIHKNEKVNNYCYSLLNPSEKGNPNYEKGLEYFFSIRTIDREFANKIEDLLYDVENNLFETIRVTTQRLNNDVITHIYSLTPITLILGGDKPKCALTIDIDEEFLKQRILKNTFKKYAEFVNKDFEPVDFIDRVEFINDNNYPSSYKGGYIIGFKVRVFLKEDTYSQEFARLLLGCGLLEKNSLSFGYCNYDFKQRRA